MFYAARHLLGDFLTAIVFVAIFAATGNLPLAIGATLLAAVAQIGWAFAHQKKLDAMVWLSLFLAIAFGSASLIAQDPRFVMAKPSIIHSAIAIAMLRRGWMLRYMDERSRIHVPAPAVIAAGYGWAGWMFTLAAANLVVALTMPFATWAWFISVGMLAAKLIAFGATYLWFRFSATRRTGSASSVTT